MNRDRHVLHVGLVACALAASAVASARACTSILVSRGASRDGSVMVTYSADAPFMPKLLRVAGGVHPPGTMVDVKAWEDDEVRGQVRQAEKTYTVVGLMNENQLSLVETTTGGRKELVDPDGQLDYDGLMLLVLQRARTAREAITLVDSLCREYGYSSSGESFSIADKNEVWLMELIGKGPGVKGVVWVAARVPDGCITAHANMSRITTFPLDDPENWRYSADVVQFATDRGYYKTDSGRPFSYRDAYHPDTSASARRACAGRVWSVYRRSAPAANFSDAWFRGEEGSEDYPLFIKPDAPLGVKDLMGLMRDHFEGTPYDMTKGVDAGPFGSPLRARDLTFKVDGQGYMWERPISTQQAGFVVVNQMRASLPDAVGGVTWFTPDEASTSCFTPFYCAVDALPASYTDGDYQKFSWDSAWWVTNLVSNLAYDRWSRVYPDVRKAQVEQEEALLKMQPVIEETAAKLAAADPALAQTFLTNYSVSTADAVFRRWQALAQTVLTTHVDGYQKDVRGEPKAPGYSPEWLRQVVAGRGAQLKLPARAAETDH
ncbi:dipeptidase [Paludisphaera mucosa]|uniref:Dipeptidase n=1 Tax=Paludisphaera mucosa TaxID=3030827 RepID=A0ABT6FBF8_9BACT|nr:C69 family dipeptidase [Paludisphaera mucosa]MDG3004920.1 C69 family dipeptidase [Paludisphaera mucosa]